MCDMSCVMCHVSRVTRVTRVRCHLSRVTRTIFSMNKLVNDFTGRHSLRQMIQQQHPRNCCLVTPFCEVGTRSWGRGRNKKVTSHNTDQQSQHYEDTSCNSTVLQSELLLYSKLSTDQQTKQLTNLPIKEAKKQVIYNSCYKCFVGIY